LTLLLCLLLQLVGVDGAHAQSLRIVGLAGFVSEWELRAEVTRPQASRDEEFSGPLTLKHIGRCSPDGPEEKHGQIRVRLLKSGLKQRLQATLVLNGAECRYDGTWSGSFNGTLDCPAIKGVPLTLSVE
jgi:hypothetical protein